MLLSAHKLCLIRGERSLFNELSFEVAAGAALRVAGPNGAGKSTLLRILCGLTSPDAGTVGWRGRAIGHDRAGFHAELFYLGHADAVKGGLLAWENIVSGAAVRGAALPRQSAFACLAQAGLDEAAELPARMLSQGQRRRLVLASLLLAPRRPLWILDEPFAALDDEASASLVATIRAHCHDGGTVVYTTHQPVDLPGATVYLGRAPEQPC